MPPEWLVPWIPLLQIVANATLAIVASLIAAASLFVAYRNNFGWPPIALVGGIGIRGTSGDSENYTALITLEIWNRHKYPISIRHIVLNFENLDIRVPALNPVETTWYIGNSYASKMKSHTLGPNEHETHEAEIPIRVTSLDSLNAPIDIRVTYFDPRRNKSTTLSIDHIYRIMPENPEIFA